MVDELQIPFVIDVEGCFQPQKGIEVMQKSIVLYEDITLLENTSTQLPGENKSWFQKWSAKVLVNY
ncbi:hypothetical protein T4B_14641 [Trichinella pseudospiralis]|uniref:Uncharacterized protein n=1 Tax=Trichinella pseudospiralis TaxID=6337 RepID=A0A0V1GA80_TRIPS|nr:hypothetical protein T4B_14641 [Trichinella pseudospiralis]